MGNKLCCSQTTANSDIRGKMTQMMTSEKVNNTTVSLILGRVFDEQVDAIVLVTNTKLKLGQNDQMNIKRFGGDQIAKEMNKILIQESGRLKVGEVMYTHGGDMDFDYILYAVLPSFCDSSMLVPMGEASDKEYCPSNSMKENIKHSNNVFSIFMNPVGSATEKQEKQQIFECLLNCLNKANELGIKSIAFPVMEPPTFHISKSIIATIMIVAIRTFLKENKTLTAVHITIPDTQTLNLFKWALTQMISDPSEQGFTSNTHDSDRPQSQHFWGIKSSMVESFDHDPDDLIRFGHAFCTSLNKSTDIKRSL